MAKRRKIRFAWKREKHVQTERSGSQLGNKRILIRERERKREEVGLSRVEEAGKGGRELDKTRRGVTLGRRTQGDGCGERERYPDEANSKRDVLLIILTAGVRLNERRSQTHGARCKFNYREEEREREREWMNDNERTKLILVQRH